MNIWSILIAVFAFGLLIFVHELGHFLAAKWAGIKVNEFAMGMGPTVFKRQKGETVYAIRAFPIGGFVAVEGEDDSSSDGHAFCNAPIYKRMIFIVSGAAMNLALGFLLLLLLSSRQTLFGTTVVSGFGADAVSSAKLQAGDEILRVNSHRVHTSNDLIYEFMRDRDGVMDMQVKRGGENIALKDVTFKMQELDGGIQMINLDFTVIGVSPTPLSTVKYAFNWTGSVVKQVWGSFVDLVTGRFGLNQLSGPIGVTKEISKVATSSKDWQSLVLLVSFITVNLGVFNLLPVPALDGGRLLFQLIELVRRKPINPRYEGYVHAVGFALLIGLMLVVTFNDVLKMF